MAALIAFGALPKFRTFNGVTDLSAADVSRLSLVRTHAKEGWSALVGPLRVAGRHDLADAAMKIISRFDARGGEQAILAGRVGREARPRELAPAGVAAATPYL
jgi:hypothetical protein